jgi:hypothetical protein
MIHPLQSESIDRLAAALTAAQAAFPPVLKHEEAEIRSAKGNYSYRYADLASVLAAVRGPLSANGLAVTQVPLRTRDASLVLRTVLMHSSGQFIAGEMEIAADLTRPQDVGSYLTYARRYSLSALVGIASEEDDDGAAAQMQARATARANGPRPRYNPDDRRPMRTERDPDAETIAAEAAYYDREQQPAPQPVRDGRWLVRAAAEKKMLSWFEAFGRQRGFPSQIMRWSPLMVDAAVKARQDANETAKAEAAQKPVAAEPPTQPGGNGASE